MLRKKSKFPIRTDARWKIWKTSLVRFLRNTRVAGRRGGQHKIASVISIAHLIIESPRRTTRSLRWRRKKKKSRNALANAGTWPDRKRNATQFRLNSVYTPIHILFYYILWRWPLQTRRCIAISMTVDVSDFLSRNLDRRKIIIRCEHISMNLTEHYTSVVSLRLGNTRWYWIFRIRSYSNFHVNLFLNHLHTVYDYLRLLTKEFVESKSFL